MKIMIAYDGSEYADVAIDGLRRAGLPHNSEALVISVVDPLASSPPTSDFDFISAASIRTNAALKRARAHREAAVEETKAIASVAADRLSSHFPEWTIRIEVAQGTPAQELLRKASEWNPDLIVAGSQGRSAIGRFFLGSVSKKVAEEAACSVRVARPGIEKPNDAPVKIVIGSRSLPDAEKLVSWIARRSWPGETEARLVAVDDGVAPGRVSSVYPDARTIFEYTLKELTAVGLKCSIDIKSGDLRSVMLEAAETCQADSIFVVAESAGDGAKLDAAAGSLIADARCTVEIVR